jgi:dienelactone hydrolase
LIGPASSVKNQIVHLYGEKLALKGFVALTFDPRTFGESEGQPRQMEVPDEKVSDFVAAVQFLSTRPGINTERIHSMGVCCGANVALKATTMDRRIRSLAYVSSCPASEPMWRMLFSDRLIDAKLVRSAAAQTAFSTGKGVNYISATESGPGLVHGLLIDPRAADYFLSPRRTSAY